VRVADGFGRYVARYVAGNTKRQAGDKGARLVRFSRTFVRSVHGAFSPFNYLAKRVQERKETLLTEFPTIAPLLGRLWSPEAAGWLSWLLWAPPPPYWQIIIDRTKEDLLLYGGETFALKERVEEYREHFERQQAVARREAEMAPAYRQLLLERKAGAGVAPDRPAGRSQVLRLPGEVWLQRD